MTEKKYPQATIGKARRDRLPKPPPETVVRGSSPGSWMLEKRHQPSVIDWKYWRHMPEAKQWEVCALSLNINPDKMKSHPDAWRAGPGGGPIFTAASFPSGPVEAEFKRRLRLLGKHIESGSFPRPAAKRGYPPTAIEVSPGEFAAWGLRVGFDDMPLELVAMADEWGRTPKAVPAPVVTPEPQAAPAKPVEAPARKPRAKRRTLWDVVAHYLIETMRAGQYTTAKELYRALEAKAGTGSPFDKGTGSNRYSLLVRDIGKPLAVKTLQNNWQKLRTEAAKK